MTAGMKTLRRIAMAAAMAAVWAAALPGADFAALRPEGHVSDFAQVIGAERKAELERYCKAVEASTGVEIALVTIPGLEGEPVEDVANLLHRKWGVGKKGTNEGILLLISIADRRTRLEVGYGLEGVIPDGYAGSVLREMRPALRAGDIGGAMAAAAQTLGERVAEAKGVKIGERVRTNEQPRGGVTGEGLMQVVISLGVLFAVLFLGNRGRRGPRGGAGSGNLLTAMVLGMMSNPPRTYGGGGFGGYDSGDSFGGFGGGDSGGGGASSDW